MNMLKKGSIFLNDKMNNKGTETIEYITGNTRRTVKATLGSTNYPAMDTNGMVTEIESRDFIVQVTFLVDKPLRGDKIKYNNETYEVMSLPNMDVVRFSDTFKKKYRIHTKLV